MNRFAKAALAGVAALAIISCSREQEIPGQEIADQVGNDGEVAGRRTLHFRALSDGTKAAFGEEDNNSWPTLWTDNDSELKLSLNYGSALVAQVTPSQDHQSASFSASIDFTGVQGPFTYYAVSPSSAAKALSPSREAWKVTIPSVQTPASGSADEGALILASVSATYYTASEAEVIDLYLGHLTAYGCLSLSNLGLQEGETVSAVELTVTTPIVGDWYWRCSDASLTDYGASSTLTINTSSTQNIWFGCAPVGVGDEALVVDVYTNLGVHEQLTAFPENSEFTAGEVAIFTVDMTGAVFTEAGSGGGGTPVIASMSTFTSVSGYVNGDENVSYAATQGDAGTAPAVNGDVIRIYQNGGLLTVTANNGKTITNVTIGSSMATTVQVKIDSGSFGSDNSITANGTYSTGTVSASTVVFKCTGTDKSHRLYLNSLSVTYEGEGGSSTSDPLLSKTVYGCYLGAGLEWEYNPGTDQVTRSYDEYGFETYTLIKPSTVEELEITGYKNGYVKGDGNIAINVNWRHGSSTVLSHSYTMKIIKEDGPKVWLSDGTTNGVIIKK
ncbi:MAG: hypothetical protein J5835_02570 [Bacteroidales bacterium]|nr:hypothetical protein [Bacteroidales bacterium]